MWAGFLNRQCLGCGQTKGEDQFPLNGTYKGYPRRHGRCNQCMSLAMKKWYSEGGKKIAIARAGRRKSKRVMATPGWANKSEIAAIYRLASAFHRSGMDVVVDHIVPLQSPLVSGLHVFDNLQIVDRKINSRKGNRHQPDAMGVGHF